MIQMTPGKGEVMFKSQHNAATRAAHKDDVPEPMVELRCKKCRKGTGRSRRGAQPEHSAQRGDRTAMTLAPPLDTVTMGLHGNALLEAAPEWPTSTYCWPCNLHRSYRVRPVLRVTFSWNAAGVYPATRSIDYCHDCAVRFCRKHGIIPQEPRKLRRLNKNGLRMFKSCTPDDERFAYAVVSGERIVKVGTKEECQRFIKD